MKKKIKLTIHTPESVCDTVRISREAAVKLRQLQRQTGLSACYLTSQMIVQGADLVEIERV